MPRDSAGHLIPGTTAPERPVPRHIPRPEYVGKPGPQSFTGSDVYSPAEIERIRTSGRIAAQAVEAVGAAIRPGVTTDELDRVAHDFLVAHDAYPSTLGYRGYPKSLCSSACAKTHIERRSRETYTEERYRIVAILSKFSRDKMITVHVG